ncbi:MAG: basic secretory protein-like protein [Eubacteriales bacterium]
MKYRHFSAFLAFLLVFGSLSAYVSPTFVGALSTSAPADTVTVPFPDVDLPEDDPAVDEPEVLSDRFLNFPQSYQKLLRSGSRNFSPDRLYENFDTVYATLCEAWNHGVFKDVDYKVDAESSGVADTRGTGSEYRSLITMYAKYYASQNYMEVDSITHELTHVCQVGYNTGYGGEDTDDNGSWIVEGMTDYSRYTYGQFPDGFALPAYSASQSYTDSYRVTARFFVWVEENICPTLTEQLNEALRTERYNSVFFLQITGYTLKELWELYAADNGRITNANGQKTSGAVTRQN